MRVILIYFQVNAVPDLSFAFVHKHFLYAEIFHKPFFRVVGSLSNMTSSSTDSNDMAKSKHIATIKVCHILSDGS